MNVATTVHHFLCLFVFLHCANYSQAASLLRGGSRSLSVCGDTGTACPPNHRCVDDSHCEDLCGACPNHKVCIVTGFAPPNEVECECPPEHFENSEGNCVTETEYFQEKAVPLAEKLSDATTPIASTSIVAVTPKQPSIEVYFQNDHAGATVNLTLLYKGVELWSDSCSEAMCEISDSIRGVSLNCQETSLQVDTAANFFSYPSVLNVTFNGITVVDWTTIFTGITTKDLKIIDTGTFKFDCTTDNKSVPNPNPDFTYNQGGGGDISFVETDEATKPKEPVTTSDTKPQGATSSQKQIEVYFQNDDSDDTEVTLSVLHQGTELWSETCTGAACVISADDIAENVKMQCRDLSLQLHRADDALFLESPSILNATYNGLVAVDETSIASDDGTIQTVRTGFYAFNCGVMGVMPLGYFGGQPKASNETESEPTTTAPEPPTNKTTNVVPEPSSSSPTAAPEPTETTNMPEPSPIVTKPPTEGSVKADLVTPTDATTTESPTSSAPRSTLTVVTALATIVAVGGFF